MSMSMSIAPGGGFAATKASAAAAPPASATSVAAAGPAAATLSSTHSEALAACHRASGTLTSSLTATSAPQDAISWAGQGDCPAMR